MVAQPQTRTKMTLAEYIALPEVNQFMELVHGELIVSQNPFVVHQSVSGNTMILLSKLKDSGRVYPPLTGVHLDDENVLQPDVLYLSSDNLYKIGEMFIEGAPDLIVEIFSPRTTRRDRVTKYELYQKHGVREYWMIDPVNQYIEVYRLENGTFVQQGIYEPGDTFDSAVLGGKTVDVTALFT